MTTASRLALAAAILLAVPAATQAEPRFGVRFGYYTEAEAPFLGAEMLFRVVPEIYFNPNVEAVLVDDGHYFTINGDLTNSGLLQIGGSGVGNRLVIAGDYVGQGGASAALNTYLWMVRRRTGSSWTAARHRA